MADFIAILLLLLCAAQGARGKFRWIPGALTGVLVWMAVCTAIYRLNTHPWFLSATRGWTSGGSIIPRAADAAGEAGRIAGQMGDRHLNGAAEEMK